MLATIVSHYSVAITQRSSTFICGEIWCFLKSITAKCSYLVVRFPGKAVSCLTCQDLTLPGSPCQLWEMSLWCHTLRHCLHYFSPGLGCSCFSNLSWQIQVDICSQRPQGLSDLNCIVRRSDLQSPIPGPPCLCRWSLLLTSAGMSPHFLRWYTCSILSSWNVARMTVWLCDWILNFI